MNLLDAATGIDGVRIDEIDGYLRAGIVEKTCCGIDDERGANDNEDVGLLHNLGSNGDIGHSLTEEHDIGAQ